MKTALLICGLLWLWRGGAAALPERMSGLASWYGESHRGRPMADGAKFNPDDLTAASWFYPLGTRVRVTLRSDPQRSVLVTITDRGPARRLVAEGRVIDLARAAFRDIAPLSQGLADVTVEPVKNTEH